MSPLVTLIPTPTLNFISNPTIPFHFFEYTNKSGPYVSSVLKEERGLYLSQQVHIPACIQNCKRITARPPFFLLPPNLLTHILSLLDTCTLFLLKRWPSRRWGTARMRKATQISWLRLPSTNYCQARYTNTNKTTELKVSAAQAAATTNATAAAKLIFTTSFTEQHYQRQERVLIVMGTCENPLGIVMPYVIYTHKQYRTCTQHAYICNK